MIAQGQIESVFVKTPPMTPYLMAYALFDTKDFKPASLKSSNNVVVTLWARTPLVDEGLAKEPLKLAVDLFDALVDIFGGVNPAAIPEKIDILAVPEYPVKHFNCQKRQKQNNA